MPADIVHDTLEALIQAMGGQGVSVAREVRVEAEAQVRAVWGGCRVYVGKTGEQSSAQRRQRDESIVRDWLLGAELGTLARRYALSSKRIRQIVLAAGPPASARGSPSMETPCLGGFPAAPYHDPPNSRRIADELPLR